MLIQEVAGDAVTTRLMALGQFLLSRAADTDSARTISVPAFLKLAANMGISLTQDRLADMIQQPPLNNIIANIEGDRIVFQGADAAPATMTTDQARLTVDNMAKRAIDIKQ